MIMKIERRRRKWEEETENNFVVGGAGEGRWGNGRRDMLER